MAIKISTGLPNCREGRQHPVGSVNVDSIKRVARLADELGFYSLWPNEFTVTRPDVAQRYADPPQLFDLIVTMSYVLAVTERIRVTPSTLVLPYHEPINLSRQLATLDVFSGGRVTLGIGLGGEIEEFRSLNGTLKKPHRGTIMDEYLEALRILWSERKATFHGKYVNFKNAEIFPKPIQRPLPILMAGHADGVLRRIATYGEGWIDSSQTPDGMRAIAEKIRAYAAEEGRSGTQFQVARQFYVSIAESVEAAQANVSISRPPATAGKPAAAAAGDERLSAGRSLIGTPDQVRAALQQYADAGATELCVIFYYPDAETAERQLRLFAREVMPAFS